MTTEMAKGLRALADFVDEHPNWEKHLRYSFNQMYVPGYSKDEFQQLVRELGGDRTKYFDEDYANVSRTFSAGVRVTVFISRDQVCERKQVGTKIEEVRDPNAPLVKVEVPVYEWVCEEPILK